VATQHRVLLKQIAHTHRANSYDGLLHTRYCTPPTPQLILSLKSILTPTDS